MPKRRSRKKRATAAENANSTTSKNNLNQEASASQKHLTSPSSITEKTSPQDIESSPENLLQVSSSDTDEDSSSTNSPPADSPFEITLSLETEPATGTTPSKLSNGLDLRAGTLCGRKLRGQNLERYLDECAPFGPEDQEWICLHFMEFVKMEDNDWLEDEYMIENFTHGFSPDYRYWDERWCFGCYEPKEQIPWYTKSLHDVLHQDWMKVDSFTTRRMIAGDVRGWFGITLDPRSIFWLRPKDVYAFYALNQEGQGGFYWCTEEMHSCYLMATDDEDLRNPLNSSRDGPFTAYLPPIVRKGNHEEDFSDSDVCSETDSSSDSDDGYGGWLVIPV